MSTLFPGFKEQRIATGAVDIFLRSGGSGPPLLLIHGFPQTHSMWHRLVPELARRYTVVLPDLRGYGYSSCPPNDGANLAYAKRTMGEDLFRVMSTLGHERFAVVGHDRGGRVAYRMALDRPRAVTALSTLDIVPTYDMWRDFTVEFAMGTYHWLFLAQPHPLPEMLIERAPIAYLDYTIARWSGTGDLGPFDERALAEYRLHYATPEHIHATCNDYRAGQTVDNDHDRADREAGRKIEAPLLALWGEAGIPASAKDVLEIWRHWATDVRGTGIATGHFLAEENPQATLAALLPFLEDHAA